VIFNTLSKRFAAALVAITAIVMCGEAFSAQCSVTNSSLGFGRYDSFSPVPTDATATIQVLCDQVVPFVVKLGPGNNSGGNFMTRQLRSGEARTPLFYNIFLDAGFSVVWGDGVGSTAPYFGNGQTRDSVVVYGRIPPMQPVAAGVYSDSVTITVEW